MLSHFADSKPEYKNYSIIVPNLIQPKPITATIQTLIFNKLFYFSFHALSF